MNTVDLSKEAEMQIKALKKISQWKTLALGVSVIGVAIMGVLGIIVMIISTIIAIILNLGLINGRKNVDKILNVLNKEIDMLNKEVIQ